MRFPAKIFLAAVSCGLCLSPVTPAMALMPAPSYSQALNSVNAAPPVEEVRHGVRHKRHAKRYNRRNVRRHGKYRSGPRRYAKPYRHHRRYGPRIGIYIAPPPVYVVPRVYAAPRVYAPPRVYGTPRNQCNYWAAQCAANWSRRSDYLGCMRYEGCY